MGRPVLWLGSRKTVAVQGNLMYCQFERLKRLIPLPVYMLGFNPGCNLYGVAGGKVTGRVKTQFSMK